MTWDWLYYLFAFLLFVANSLAWSSSLLMLPGNWIIVVFTAIFAFFYPEQDGHGIRWTVVLIVLGLAILGEVIELLAGSAGAAKQGASRRAMFLSLVGAIVGSVFGAIVGVPIPIVGPIVGALGGGCIGVFAGAYGGEVWKGTASDESVSIGKAAVIGRLLGTMGKMAVGAIAVAMATIDSLI